MTASDIPATMRCALYRSTGPAAKVFEIDTIPVPRPGAGEVLVRVAASGVNPHDTKLRAGWSHAAQDFPVVPHGDGSGIIVAVGADVDAGRVGQRVWFFGAGAGGATGSAAEFTCVQARHAIALAERVDFTEGACLGIPALTAHRAVHWGEPVRDRTVLVAGGAGAVASYAIQFARAAGARVATTVSSAEKAEHVQALGADLVINYRTEDVAVRVNEFTGGRGIDRIVEVDFGANVGLNAEILAPLGVIASYSSTHIREPVLPYYPLAAKSATIRMIRDSDVPDAARRAAIDEISTGLADGSLRNFVAAGFDLEQIAEAHDAQDDGGRIGNIVVRIDGSPAR